MPASPKPRSASEAGSGTGSKPLSPTRTVPASVVALPAASVSRIAKPPVAPNEWCVGSFTSALVSPNAAPAAVTMKGALAPIDVTTIGRYPNKSGAVAPASKFAPHGKHSADANNPPPALINAVMSAFREIKPSNSARVNVPPNEDAIAMAL